MKLANFTRETLTKALTERVMHIDSRERIVIKMPFNCKVSRIEIYCGETEPKNKNGAAYFGEKFTHIVTVQQFNDYSNSPYSKKSYTYKNDLLKFLPKLVNNLFNMISE